MIEAAISSGGFSDSGSGEENDRRWFARITFRCPSCQRKNVVMQNGSGHLPDLFSVECKRCQAVTEAVPYRSPLLKQQ